MSEEPRELLAAHGIDIGAAAVELADLLGVDIETDGLEARTRGRRGERQTDIAEPDDADRGGTGGDAMR